MTFELDDLFDGRRNSGLETRSVFTNRYREIEAFESAFERLGATPIDDGRPFEERSNVLCYFGIGGIGKSTLSQELQRRFLNHGAEARFWWRANFEETELLDFESLLLSMRAQLGMQRPQWPAFDIAFQVYWNLKYPGVPLHEFAASSGRARRVMGKVNLGDQIRSTCESILLGGIPLIEATGKVANVVVKAARMRAKKRELFADCAAFARLIELESAAEILPFLPVLLEHDLSTAGKRGDAGRAVFFLDNFETVQSASSEFGSPEDLIARMCFLLPNVLFVISGRNRLSWATPQFTLHYSGAEYWPQLTSESETCAQFPVEGLSQEHCVEFIQNRLTRDGQPAISTDIATSIAKRSAGLPLYLNLSVDHFRSLDSRGIATQATNTDFERDFPQIVQRLMRDLPLVERSLLRTAALLGAFDGDLLRACSAGVADADINRFLARNFVRRSPTAWLPCSLHPILRDSIVQHDTGVDDGWTDRERADRARACLAALFERVAPLFALPDSSVGDPAAAALMTTSRLLTFVESWPDWVMQLAYLLRVFWRTSALRYPFSEAPHTDTALDSFGDLCLAMALRCDGQQSEAVPILRTLLERADLTSEQRFFVINRLGKTLEEFGEVAEAEALLAGAAAGLRGPLRVIAEKDHARLLLQHGVEQPALDWASPRLNSLDLSQRRQANDLVGWVHLFAGRLDEAEIAFRNLFERRHDPITSLDIHVTERALALVLAWGARPEAKEIIDLAIETNTGLGSKIGLAQCEMAAAVHETIFGSDDDGRVRLERATSLMTSGHYANEYWMLHLTSLGMAAAKGEWGNASAASDRLVAELERVSYHPHLTRIGRSTKWERLTGPVEYLVGGQPDAAANWLRLLRNLYTTRLARTR